MNRQQFILCSVILALLNIVDSGIYLRQFGFEYCDGDQAIFWNQAQDISKGVIHQLYLYGQDYNIPLESFIAAIPMALGLPAIVALPLVGICMMLASFYLIAYRAFKQQHRSLGLLAMGMPLLMPFEWQALSSMPRGFYGGIFIATIAIAVFDPKKTSKLILALLIGIIALNVNPNSALLIGGFALVQIFNNEIPRKALIISSIWAISVIGFLAILKYSIQDHAIHSSWSLSWSWDYFKTFLSNFNEHFKGTAPLTYNFGFISIILLVSVLLLASFRKEKKLVLAIAFFLLGLVISFGINKVNDGGQSIFYSYSRMYLALPLVFLVFLNSFQKDIRISSTPLLMIMSTTILLGIAKIGMSQTRIQKSLKIESPVVQYHKIERVHTQCDDLLEMLKEEQVSSVVFYSAADALNYGCSVLNDIKTFYLRYERRVWLENDMLQTPLNEILFMDWTHEMIHMHPELNLSKVDGPLPGYRTNDKGLFKDLFSKSNFAE